MPDNTVTSIVPIVRVRDLRKCYGALDVLRGVSLDIPQGQTVSIIGPSGSGKSTLLRLLMTHDQPDGGGIEIDGESPWPAVVGAAPTAADKQRLRRVRGKVGMVFQHFNLFPHMSALRNVMEAPQLVLGLPAAEARARALEYLQQVGLADKAQAFPGQLSGGQMQRVAIARALAMRPQVMLFDEITSALDPELVGGILALLRDLSASRNLTMLIVTHHMHFAAQCSDRVLFFDQGVVLEDGPPRQIFHESGNERNNRPNAANRAEETLRTSLWQSGMRRC